MSVLDLFLKLFTEDMLLRATIDAASYFLLPISQLLRKESFLRKAVLTRHAKSQWLNRHRFCFVSISKLTIIQRTWRWPMLGLGILLVRHLHACAPGYCSWSVQARRLNSVATCALGVLGGINCRQWSARSNALAFPLWPLEGLLFAAQKLVWERTSVLLVASTWSRLYRTYAWGATTGQPCFFAGRKFLWCSRL